MRKINPVPISAVEITSPIWSRNQTLVKDVVIPYQWEAVNDRIPGAEPSCCIKNLEIAAKRREGEFHGFVFQDSDLYKWLEAVAFSLEAYPDSELESKADWVIELLEEAQMPDGYINSYFQLKAADARWGNLNQAHELYCAGHLIEAAVAYAKATGKRRLLDIAIRFADLLDNVFGPEEGKCKGYPGHQEIELALVKLWQTTGEERYLNLADYFIRERGSEPYYFDEEKKLPNHIAIWPETEKTERCYNQSHLPPVDQTEAVGHSVRAMYMYSAMADLSMYKDNDELLQACRKLYDNVTNKQMYITGGIGATPHGEAFTGAYDLPMDSVYAETCASIGLMMFCQRMHLLEHDGRYIDTLEQALYNTVMSGMSLNGREFFYVNPLSVHPSSCECNPGLNHVKPVRQPWFACACCPPNVARTLMSLGSYAYSASDDELYVNLYISSKVSTKLSSGNAEIEVETEYPCRGTARITANGGEYKLYLRNPSYAPVTKILVNNNEYEAVTNNGYITVPVSGNIVIDIVFDLKPRLVYSHSNVHHTLGKTAVCAGPVLYCAESCDNEYSPSTYYLPTDVAFEYETAPSSLPDTMPALTTTAYRLVSEDKSLYMDNPPHLERAKLTLIPYSLWNNRGKSEMEVYLHSLPLLQIDVK